MSTEHQQYSTENQAIAILQYAQLHHMDIVHTYADHGKSGLGLAKRAGLRQLLKDAVSPDAGYRAILVYDVSRWGRFQNPDQGASYEYALTLANVPVHYCAEQFSNDGSLASALLKSLKRGMAGEYSRELSEKVFAGQKRLVELGFRLGGMPGYGLRRHLIDYKREFKQILKHGDRKSLQSDRVILVHGPAEEIKIVRTIYRWFTKDLLTERLISERLNSRAIGWIGQRPWTARVVREILANPKYIGASVYNRKSFKLSKNKVYNPPEEWICNPLAFEPIVTRKQFEVAQLLLSSRTRSITSEMLIDRLKHLLNERGYLSSGLIDSLSQMPSITTYRKRFGTLRTAYALAGFNGLRNTRLAKTDGVIRDVQMATEKLVIEHLERSGARATKVLYGRSRSFLVDDEHSLRIVPVRCSQTKNHGSRWFVQIRPSLAADITIIVRLDETNSRVLDYFIFPQEVISSKHLKLAVHNPLHMQIFRFPNLEILERLTQRSKIEDIRSSTDHSLARKLVARTRLATLGSRREVDDVRGSSPSSAEPRMVSICREKFQKQIDLVTRAESLVRRALALACSLCTLLADADFRTVLRAEKIVTMPQITEASELLSVKRVREGELDGSSASSIFGALLNSVTLAQLLELLPIDYGLISWDAREDDSICPIAASLLQTYPVCVLARSLLKRLQPGRQVEVAEHIAAHSDWSPGFVRVLAYATKSTLLVDGFEARRNSWSMASTQEFAQKSASLLQKLKSLGPGLGQGFLFLAVCQRNVSRLLTNPDIRSYLVRRHPDVLIVLQQSEPSVWL